MTNLGMIKMWFLSPRIAAFTIICGFHDLGCMAGHAPEVTFPKDAGVLDVRISERKRGKARWRETERKGSGLAFAGTRGHPFKPS